jgi:hypothetical protein
VLSYRRGDLRLGYTGGERQYDQYSSGSVSAMSGFIEAEQFEPCADTVDIIHIKKEISALNVAITFY